MKLWTVILIALVVILANNAGSIRAIFRGKRNLGDVVSGISPTKFTSTGGGSYGNGKSCLTGRDPFKAEEVELVRKFYSLELGEDKKKKVQYNTLTARNVHKHMSQRLNKLYGENCQSKICSLDLVKMGLICGKLSRKEPFENGKGCLDGLDLIPAEEYMKINSEGDLKRQESTFPVEINSAELKEARLMYGKNCKSGNCTYDAERGAYVCADVGTVQISQFLFIFTLISMMAKVLVEILYVN